jgi:hypothetical protein
LQRSRCEIAIGETAVAALPEITIGETAVAALPEITIGETAVAALPEITRDRDHPGVTPGTDGDRPHISDYTEPHRFTCAAPSRLVPMIATSPGLMATARLGQMGGLIKLL